MSRERHGLGKDPQELISGVSEREATASIGRTIFDTRLFRSEHEHHEQAY
jgi:hypothetical protein